MISDLVAISDEGREPTGAEIDLVTQMCRARRAEMEAAAFKAELLSRGYSEAGLAGRVFTHIQRIKAEARGL